MIGEPNPTMRDALLAIDRFSEGHNNLLETTVAVSAVRNVDREKARPLEVRFLRTVRSKAIAVLMGSTSSTPLQRELTSRVVNVIEGMAEEESNASREDGEPSLRMPDVSEGVSAMPDLGYAAYTLTLKGKVPRPQDAELEIVAQPALTLSSIFEEEETHTGLSFTQGTHTHETFEGIVLATTRTDGTGYWSTIRAPEEAPVALRADLEAFLARVESGPLYCRALGAFSLQAQAS